MSQVNTRLLGEVAISWFDICIDQCICFPRAVCAPSKPKAQSTCAIDAYWSRYWIATCRCWHCIIFICHAFKNRWNVLGHLTSWWLQHIFQTYTSCMFLFTNYGSIANAKYLLCHIDNQSCRLHFHIICLEKWVLENGTRLFIVYWSYIKVRNYFLMVSVHIFKFAHVIEFDDKQWRNVM